MVVFRLFFDSFLFLVCILFYSTLLYFYYVRAYAQTQTQLHRKNNERKDPYYVVGVVIIIIGAVGLSSLTASTVQGVYN